MAFPEDYPKFTYRTEVELMTDLSDKEAHDFFNHFRVTVSQKDRQTMKEEEIAYGYFSQILLEESWKAGFSTKELFYHDEGSVQLESSIINFESDDFIDPIKKFYGQHLANHNIFFFRYLHLAKAFRGKQFGKKILKTIYNLYSTNCGVVIFAAAPAQFEKWHFANMEVAKKYMAKMAFEQLGLDDERCTYKLYSYFQSLGFENILGDQYFFAPPAYATQKIKKEMFT